VNDILSERYASSDMCHIFSKESRYGKWRLVWLTLAEAQSEIPGFPIDPNHLEKCRETAAQIDFVRVAEIEAETRHDVMAHLKYWAEICPEVQNTIHLGATSCFVTDNAECVLHKEALALVAAKIKELCAHLALLAKSTAGRAVVGYTHFQPASPTTIGKRIAMWIQDLINDYNEIARFHDGMLCRGVKGTTGTQASYLELVEGKDRPGTIKRLDRAVARKLKFAGAVELSGQTISRKQDARIADLLSGLAITLSKIGHDVRLLSHTGDLREGFGNKQVGSSAMPYKRNPMLAERLCALTRLIPQYRDMLTQTAMTQWLERSLDDSATRRIAIPDMFLAVDGALNTAFKLANKLEACAQKDNFKDQAFMTSELLLASAIKRGFNRLEAHERLKDISLLARLTASPEASFWSAVNGDPMWKDCPIAPKIIELHPKELTGLATLQTIKFLQKHKDFLE
jgi:adenylosuccinate lyase